MRHHDKIYVSDETFVHAVLLKRYHDDELTKHFETNKTVELLARKYYWKNMIKYVRSYVKICDICQRTKISRHRFYDELMSLSQFFALWKKISMNFFTKFLFNKYQSNIYDSCLMIVNRYIKMTLYISVIKNINAMKLIEIIDKRVNLQFDSSKEIVSNRDFIFTNSYWAKICFYLKIKRRLSIAFHSQTDEQTIRQNQAFEHYLRVFCTENQTNWANLLIMTQYTYNSSIHSTIDINFFYVMYDYNSEIELKIENDFSRKKMSTVKEKIKKLHKFKQTLSQRWTNVVEL